MGGARYIYWQDGAQWLGYFEEYPDYMTQGESLEDLREHLKDLYRDLTSGAAVKELRNPLVDTRGSETSGPNCGFLPNRDGDGAGAKRGSSAAC